MKNAKRLNDLIEIETRGVSSDCPVTCSQSWVGVADVMSKNVATISPDETVVSAARMMSERKISCLAVMDKGNVAGILTETDILKRVASNGKHFYQTRLDRIMSYPVESIPPDISVLRASEIMAEKRIRRLPVVEKDKLVGIVTQTDLVRSLTSYGLWKDISEVMNHNIALIQADASVAEAAKVMTAQKTSCIVAIDGDDAAGVLTEKDMLRRVVALKRDPARITMREVMSSPVISIPANCSVFSAGKMMEEMNVRRLAVMENRRLCGVVTQTDIFMAIRDKLQTEEEANLSLLEESKNGIYTTDLDGVITYVNPAFIKLLEVSDEAELTGRVFLPERFGLDSDAREKFLRELKRGSIESRELALKTARGNRIYVTVGQDTMNGRGPGALTCINAENGHVVWQSTEIDRSLATVSVVDDLVYVTDYSGYIHCLDAQTGRHCWKLATESPLWSSTLVTDGKLFVGTEKRDFWIMQAGKQKKVLNKIRFPDKICNTPVVANGVMYVTTERYLYAIGD